MHLICHTKGGLVNSLALKDSTWAVVTAHRGTVDVFCRPQTWTRAQCISLLCPQAPQS